MDAKEFEKKYLTKVPTFLVGPTQHLMTNEESERLVKKAKIDELKYEGLESQINTAISAAANTATLGAYSVLRDPLLTDEEKEQYHQEKVRNPISRMIGQGVGLLAGIALAPESGALGGAYGALMGVRGGLLTRGAVGGAVAELSDLVEDSSIDPEFARQSFSSIGAQVLFGAGLGVAGEAAFAGLGLGVKKGLEWLKTDTKLPALGDLLSKSKTMNAEEKAMYESATESTRRITTAETNVIFYNNITRNNENLEKFLGGINDGTVDAKKAELDLNFIKYLGTDEGEKLLKDGMVGEKDISQFYQTLTDREKVKQQIIDELKSKGEEVNEQNIRVTMRERFNDSIASVEETVRDLRSRSTVAADEVVTEAMGNPSYAAAYDQGAFNNMFGPTGTYARMREEMDILTNSKKRAIRALKDQGIAIDKNVLEKEIAEQRLTNLSKGYTSVVDNFVNKINNISDASAEGLFKYIQKGVRHIDDIVYTNHQSQKAGLTTKVKISDKEFAHWQEFKKRYTKTYLNAENFGPEVAKNVEKTDLLGQLNGAVNAFYSLLRLNKGGKGLPGETTAARRAIEDKSKPLARANLSSNMFTESDAPAFKESLEKVRSIVNELYEKFPEMAEESMLVQKIAKLSATETRTGAETLSLLNSNIDKFLNTYDMTLKYNDKRLEEWEKFVSGGAKEREAQKMGLRKRTMVVQGIKTAGKQAATGDFGQAGITGMRTISRITDEIFASKTAETEIKKAVTKINESMQEISRKPSKLKQKMSEGVDAIVSRDYTKPMSVVRAALIPYSVKMMVSATNQDIQNIDNQYEQIKYNLIKKDIFIELENAMDGVSRFYPRTTEQIKDHIYQAIGVLKKDLPVGNPQDVYNAVISTENKAKFLDKLDALMNPEKCIDMITAGTITKDQLDTFKQFSPTLYNTMLNDFVEKVAFSDVSDEVKSAGMRLFGVENSDSAFRILNDLVRPPELLQAQAEQQAKQARTRQSSRPIKSLGASMTPHGHL